MLEDGPKLRLFARVSLRFSRSASDSRLRDHLVFFCNWKSHPWNILPGTKCHPNITNYLPQNLHHSHTQKKYSNINKLADRPRHRHHHRRHPHRRHHHPDTRRSQTQKLKRRIKACIRLIFCLLFHVEKVLCWLHTELSETLFKVPCLIANTTLKSVQFDAASYLRGENAEASSNLLGSEKSWG